MQDAIIDDPEDIGGNYIINEPGSEQAKNITLRKMTEDFYLRLQTLSLNKDPLVLRVTLRFYIDQLERLYRQL